jgi:hypothetical protein
MMNPDAAAHNILPTFPKTPYGLEEVGSRSEPPNFFRRRAPNVVRRLPTSSQDRSQLSENPPKFPEEPPQPPDAPSWLQAAYHVALADALLRGDQVGANALRYRLRALEAR